MAVEDRYRLMLAAIMVAGLAMSLYFRRKADRAGGTVARREDGPAILIVLTLSGACAIGGLLVYLIHPPWMRWSQWALPAWLRLLGGPLGVVALALFFSVFCFLGPNVTPTAQTRSQHTLVMGGPYRWVRHPMYASGLVLFAAYALLTANWFVAVMCSLAFAALFRRTSTEEANLIKCFGEDYRAYMQRTGRFLPRLRRRPQKGI